MYTNTQQLWLSWSQGEIDDASAQAAAEAAHARGRSGQGGGPARPQDSSAPISWSGRGMRREKVFGEGRLVPLDRNAKVRIMVLARALMRRTERGKHYGAVTAKFLAVLETLLWGFHNAASGKCFPSYEAIADRAGCARRTVYEAIRALERLGILTWCNRLKRVREYVPGLFGKASAWRWRVVRTSNAYVFIDPGSKCKKTTETATQDSTKKDFVANGPHTHAHFGDSEVRHRVVPAPEHEEPVSPKQLPSPP